MINKTSNDKCSIYCSDHLSSKFVINYRFKKVSNLDFVLFDPSHANYLVFSIITYFVFAAFKSVLRQIYKFPNWHKQTFCFNFKKRVFRFWNFFESEQSHEFSICRNNWLHDSILSDDKFEDSNERLFIYLKTYIVFVKADSSPN